MILSKQNHMLHELAHRMAFGTEGQVSWVRAPAVEYSVTSVPQPFEVSVSV